MVILSIGGNSSSSFTYCRRVLVVARVSFPAFDNKFSPPPLLSISLCRLLIFLLLYSMLVLIFLLLCINTVIAQCPFNCVFCKKVPECSLCIPAYSLTSSGLCTPHVVANCRVY